MIALLPDLMLPFILYAETHYKFKGIYSRLKKSEPEIIADAPFRVEPNHPIPILLLVKDAHRYPIQLEEVIITISLKNSIIFEQRYSLHIPIENNHFWYQTFFIKKPENCYGFVQLDVQFTLKVNGKIKNL